MTVPITVKVKGNRELIAKLKRIAAETPKVVGGALKRFSHRVIAASQPLVPRKTGHLRRSKSVEGPSYRNNVIMTRIGYNTPYAVVQHERLDYHHPKGQAHYLIEPARKMAPDMPKEVAADVDKMLKNIAARGGKPQ